MTKKVKKCSAHLEITLPSSSVSTPTQVSLTSTFPPTAGNRLENISRFLPGQRSPPCFRAAGITMFSDTTNGGGRSVLPFQLSSLCFLAATPPCAGGEGISSHWSQEREVTGFAWLNHHKPKGSFAHLELLTGCLICSEKKSKTKNRPQARQATAHTEKQVCLEILEKQRAEAEAGGDTWMGSFHPSTRGQVWKRLGLDQRLVSYRYGCCVWNVALV